MNINEKFVAWIYCFNKTPDGNWKKKCVLVNLWVFIEPQIIKNVYKIFCSKLKDTITFYWYRLTLWLLINWFSIKIWFFFYFKFNWFFRLFFQCFGSFITQFVEFGKNVLFIYLFVYIYIYILPLIKPW